MKKEKFLTEVKRAVLSIDNNAQVILFGSRARGDSKQGSDWDFLILTSSALTEKRKRVIRDKLVDTEIEAEQAISTIIYHRKRWNDISITPLYQNVMNEGIEL